MPGRPVARKFGGGGSITKTAELYVVGGGGGGGVCLRFHFVCHCHPL